MRRIHACVLALLVLLSAVVPAVAAVPDARLTVSGLTVTPDAPVTDEPVTVSVTVQNSGGSPSPVTVDQVRLQRADGGDVLARASGPGALSQGDSLTVDLVTAFGAAGQQDLEVVIVGTDANDEQTRVVRPLTVVVERAPPGLDAVIEDPVAEVETRVAVTVTNPTTTDRRNLELTVEGANAVDSRTNIPALAAGASTTVNVSTRLPVGESNVSLALAYTTSTGERDVTRLRVPVEAQPLREDVGVAVRTAPETQPEQQAVGQLGSILGGGGAPGGGQALQSQDDTEDGTDRLSVEVTNFGNAPIADVVVTPQVGDRTLPRRAVDPLTPGESATVTVDLTNVPAGTLTAVASYRVVGTDRTGNATGQFAYDPPAGEVRLTDVDLRFDGAGRLVVTGNAGNVGDGEVTGVVVAVSESEHVAPAYPQRDYFVGTVEGSEFAPFELTADVDAANATTIPVTVSYRVGGEARTENVSLAYDDSLAPAERRSSPAASLSIPFGTAGLALGLLVGAVVFVPTALFLRRRR